MTEILDKYFKELTPLQRERFAALEGLYREWNAKINVISRKDMDNLYEHHVLHSLAIAKAVTFAEDSSVLDVGTGGGFPGIPLAILFPKVRFTLCDSIGKKIKVASAVAEALGLDNVECVNCRVETLSRKFDYTVSRAVASLPDLYGFVKCSVAGLLICLKGGDVETEAELCAAKFHIPLKKFTICPVSVWFDEEFFKEKNVVILAQ